MNPEDLCQRCADPRRVHNPPKMFTYFHASGYSSGGGTPFVITARTCCMAGQKADDGYSAICLCTAFVEPGQCCCLFAEVLKEHLHPRCPMNVNNSQKEEQDADTWKLC